MKERTRMIACLAVAIAAAAAILVQNAIVGPAVAAIARDEIAGQLRLAMEDARRLAELAPQESAAYRQRFDEISRLRQRLLVLDRSRGRLASRLGQINFAMLALFLVAASGAFLQWRRLREIRLVRVRSAIDRLAGGESEISLDERGGDAIARIARTVEEASRTWARDRQRLQSLESLERWQSAARDLAHEVRTPLATARLELDRLRGQLELAAETDAEPARRIAAIAVQIDRLGELAREFGSFGGIAPPRPVDGDLASFLRDFVDTYALAWPGLELRVAPASPVAESRFDPELLRQVLFNLCANSATALGGREGTVLFELERGERVDRIRVSDDGPGVPIDIRGRLFEPYFTTRKGGRGTGLGLAISKKILLDHGGDLRLIDATAGTAFELELPRLEATVR